LDAENKHPEVAGTQRASEHTVSLSGTTLTGLDEFIISRRRNSVVEVKRRLERQFFESEEKMKVGVSSVRIDRVQIGSNKDRQMKNQ